jgi:conjugative relaxase-like TrwC/TraI family protein
MLRITESKSALAAKAYFDRALRHADYYQKGAEIQGHWYGLGAARFGLTGEVTRHAFQSLIDNRHPLTGDKLTPRQKADRRVGADFTFNAPKSVSLLHALSGDARILEAFRKAVIATMRDVERDVKTRVRMGGKNEDRVSGNMVWAEFLHLTARPVDGVPDPHMHIHAYALNLTHDGKEQRWKAAQLGDIVGERPYYEAVFLSRLARYMRGLGYEIDPHGKYWDIAGLSRPTIEKFSRRTAEIDEAAAELKIIDPDAKGALGAKTRAHKRLDLTDAELKGHWLRRLDVRERVTLDGLAAKARLGGLPISKTAAREAAQLAIDHAFERASVASERKLLADALIKSYGRATPEEVIAAAERVGLMRGTIKGRRVISTKAVLAEEERLVAFARAGRASCRPLAETLSISAKRLNAQQRAAVEHLWQSPDRVMVLRGGAGTGKTTLMQEAVAGMRARGHEVRVFAPTAAARDVLKGEGFLNAETLQRLLIDQSMQAKLAPGSVLWVDEAGLICVPDMVRLFALAEARSLRIILSGDSRQHSSVVRGDALRLIEERAGIRPAEVSTILRQKGRYREAVEAIAGGDLETGWMRFEAMGAVLEIPDDAARFAAIADAYMQASEAGRSVLIVSPTHAEKDRVTEMLREQLTERGKLGAEQEVTILRDLRWTEAERRDAGRYREGMIVKFVQNDDGFVRGDRCVVASATREHVTVSDPEGIARILPLDAASRFKVYACQPKRFAPGDLVRITEQGESADGHKLVNGAVHQLAGFTGRGDLQLVNGWVVPRWFGHLDHGYVTTSVSSQGRTVDRVLIAMSARSAPATFFEQFYVTVSRGREAIQIFTDDAQAMKSAVARTGARGAALELLDGKLDEALKPASRSTRLKTYQRQLEQTVKRLARERARGADLDMTREAGRVVRGEYQGRVEERAADAGR